MFEMNIHRRVYKFPGQEGRQAGNSEQTELGPFLMFQAAPLSLSLPPIIKG